LVFVGFALPAKMSPKVSEALASSTATTRQS
jgi:hypothetical protein